MQIRLKRCIVEGDGEAQFDVFVDDGAEEWQAAGTIMRNADLGYWIWASTGALRGGRPMAGHFVAECEAGLEVTKEAAARACASAYWAATRS